MPSGVYIRTAEARANMRAAHLGKKYGRGRVHTAATKSKISASKMGVSIGPMSEATKVKIGAANKGNTSNLGRVHTPEHNANISAGHILYMSENRGPWRDTKPELAFEVVLLRTNTRYEKQRRLGRFVVDFYLPDFKQVVEIDGCYWHGCPECFPASKYNDKFAGRAEKLLEHGYYAVRIWEHDLQLSE